MGVSAVVPLHLVYTRVRKAGCSGLPPPFSRPHL